MSDAVERLINLALYLADAREPVTAERIRADVFGYPEFRPHQREVVKHLVGGGDAFVPVFSGDAGGEPPEGVALFISGGT